MSKTRSFWPKALRCSGSPPALLAFTVSELAPSEVLRPSRPSNMRFEALSIGRSRDSIDDHWPANGSHLSGGSAAAKEAVATIGFKPRDSGSRRHSEAFQHFASLGIDASDIALLVLPCAVPELAVDPGDARDEAIGFDGA